VKDTSKSLGVTINDLMLAITAGALRQLLLEHGDSVDRPLIASAPISTDSSPDRLSGNRFGSMMVSLPVDSDDPLEHVRRVHHSAKAAKEASQQLGPDLLNRWAAYMPPPLAPAVMRWASARDIRNKLFNVPVSNVKGPRNGATSPTRRSARSIHRVR
jgi:diacylglycerol O-acyltransferase / wax synthase